MNNSALRTLDILEYIAKADKALSITEISKELNLPKSSVFDIIQVLQHKQFIEPNRSDSKTYKIGLKAYQIGYAYINNVDLFKIAKPILKNIKDAIDETVYLAVEDNGNIVYLDKVENSFPIRSTCSIGSRNLMHITGIGKAILAGYDDDKIINITKDKFVAKTNNSIMDFDTLIKHMQEIRQQGYALDNGEDIEIVRCVAAPIRDKTNNVIAAISVSMLDSHFSEEKRKAAIEAIVNSALEISNRLGYMLDKLY